MLKYKIFSFLFRRCNFLFVSDEMLQDGVHKGSVIETLTEGDKDSRMCITGILVSAMENRPKIADAIFDAVLSHLRRYEIDKKHFIEKLYEEE